MIEKLILSESDFIYIRLKALIWKNNGLKSPATVYFSSVESIKEIYEKIEPRKPLIISCKGVVDGGDRSFENFFADIVKPSKRPIIFIHTFPLIDLLLSSIRSVGAKAPNSEQIPEENIFKVNCTEPISILKNINSVIEEVEKKFIHDTFKGCYKPDKSGQLRLLSTVVKAKGEFDACKIISEPHLFIWICLILADALDTFIKNEIEDKERNPNSPELRLLVVSLRGSPFASAVSMLINKRYDTIDHLGPRHKLFDLELLDNFKKGIRYFYIGDFIVGGTEVKIAKAYAEILGCELNHAIVLSSWLNPDVFKDNFNLISLTRIKEIVPDADYQLLDK
jgi:hypothetical protein